MSAPITIDDLEAVLWHGPTSARMKDVEFEDVVEFLEYENLRLTVELEGTQARLRGIMTACFAG